MTAPVGWMAVRFGRKNLHIACMAGFVIASMLCGTADTLSQMVRVPLPAGHLRRRAGAAVAGHHARHLSVRAPRPGDGDLRHGRDGGADHGPDARRLSDRDVQLALRVLRQPAVRHPGDHRPAAVPAESAAAHRAEIRLDRLRRAGDGRRRAATDAGPRPEAGLVLLAARSSSRRCWPASASICSWSTCSPPQRPFLPPGLFKDRNFVCRRDDGVLHRHGDAGEFRADGAVSGKPRRLPGGDRGPVDGAARHRHHDRHAARQPAGQPVRPPQADGGRPADPGLRAVLHERLDARRAAAHDDADAACCRVSPSASCSIR